MEILRDYSSNFNTYIDNLVIYFLTEQMKTMNFNNKIIFLN